MLVFNFVFESLVFAMLLDFDSICVRLMNSETYFSIVIKVLNHFCHMIVFHFV